MLSSANWLKMADIKSRIDNIPSLCTSGAQLTANTHSYVNLCEEVSNTEMTQAIHNMKCGKAPEPDKFTQSLLRTWDPPA